LCSRADAQERGFGGGWVRGGWANGREPGFEWDGGNDNVRDVVFVVQDIQGTLEGGVVLEFYLGECSSALQSQMRCAVEIDWCILYFEPVGSNHRCERKHFAVYGYDVFGYVETTCVTHHGCRIWGEQRN
jgi:hypothetical protein